MKPSREFQFDEWQRRIDLYADGASVHRLRGLIGELQGVEYLVKARGWDKQCEDWFDKYTLEIHQRTKRP